MGKIKASCMAHHDIITSPLTCVYYLIGGVGRQADGGIWFALYRGVGRRRSCGLWRENVEIRRIVIEYRCE
jgi:hypothetical protein